MIKLTVTKLLDFERAKRCFCGLTNYHTECASSKGGLIDLKWGLTEFQLLDVWNL